MSVVGAAIVVASVLVASALYLVFYLRWEQGETNGSRYFMRPAPERLALKRRIRWYSLPAKPLVHLLARIGRKRSAMPTFEYGGVCGPPKLSSAEVFARAANYAPRPDDVFVATQMRSGTTWMQQLVYQIVTRGDGELDARGRGHLYAVSPWLDALTAVTVDEAPLVGEKPVRIIKTHLPTQLCPYAAHAKYIYVARHPVRCFASIVDFNRALLGPLLPPFPTLVDWFCSDRMYWLPWPRHVDGWWRWATERKNVLFVHYEAMIGDFGNVRDAVAAFLGCALTPDEKRRVDEKCSVGYMKAHEASFEMASPTMFSAGGAKFLAAGGSAGGRRERDVPALAQQQITAYCREALSGSAYPLARFYPDVAAGSGAPPAAARVADRAALGRP